jgi:hypothetical protein
MTHRLVAALAGIAACGLAGCSMLPPPSPVVDGLFGTSVRHAIAAQTARPDAARQARGPETFDAQSAVSALARHRASFKAPPPTFNVIGITAGE